MSKITEVIITASLYGSQQPFKAQLDAYTDQLHVPAFVQIDKCTVGGDNCLRTDVFVAAFKNFAVESFIDFFKSLHYANQEIDPRKTLQVFIRQPQDALFAVYIQDTIDQLRKPTF